MQSFPAAPWPKLLKGVSAFCAAVLLSAGVVVWMAIPPHGFAHTLVSLAAWAPPAIGATALLFTVTGYEVDMGRLYVRRLLWATTIDLTGLKEVRHDPDALKGSVRIFGNGGLFAFTGLYENKKLGRYRLFATDSKCSVVLVTPGRTVVVTPADPDAFVLHMKSFFSL